MGVLCYWAMQGVCSAVYATAGYGTTWMAGAIGFGAAGPAGATIAAGAQSYIGNVVAGSLFAECQAAAMAAPI